MAGRSIRLVLALAVGVAVTGTGLVAALLAGELSERAVEDAAAESLRDAAGLFAALERVEIQKMSALLEDVRGRADLREAFLAGDRTRLLALAGPVFGRIRARDGVITHLYFIEPNRTCFLRVHRPDLHGDRIERMTLARAAESGNTSSGMELGQTAYALRVVRPWFDGPRLIGFVEMAEEIGHFLVRMKQETGDDFGLLAKKKYLDEKTWYRVIAGGRDTWSARPDVVVVDSTSYGEGLIDYRGDVDAIPETGQALGETIRNGRALIRGIFPVRDAADRRVGALLVQQDFTRMHAALERGRIHLAATVLLASLLGFGLAWLAVELLLLRRLRRVAEALAPAVETGPDAGDELQRLARLAALRHPAARQSDAPPER